MNEQFKKLFLHLALASRELDKPTNINLSPREINKMLLDIEGVDEKTEYDNYIDTLRHRIERLKYLSP